MSRKFMYISRDTMTRLIYLFIHLCSEAKLVVDNPHNQVAMP